MNHATLIHLSFFLLKLLHSYNVGSIGNFKSIEILSCTHLLLFLLLLVVRLLLPIGCARSEFNEHCNFQFISMIYVVWLRGTFSYSKNACSFSILPCSLKEIRNRHWLEVMAVTGTSFQLEANVFKLMHLLDSHLAEYVYIRINSRFVNHACTRSSRYALKSTYSISV